MLLLPSVRGGARASCIVHALHAWNPALVPSTAPRAPRPAPRACRMPPPSLEHRALSPQAAYCMAAARAAAPRIPRRAAACHGPGKGVQMSAVSVDHSAH